MAKPATIHLRIVELLRTHPGGLTSGEIRAKLGLDQAEQAQLDRRRRELYVWYEIERVHDGAWRYILIRERQAPRHSGAVPARLRGQVKFSAHGRCQMCGKTTEKHGIALVVDHKIPQDWGGTNDVQNLWAICEECNAEKKNYFSAQDADVMREVIGHSSIHVRLGEVLKLMRTVAASTLSLVGGQADWMKRIRELRYLGWNFETSRKRLPGGGVEAVYTLTQYQDWPDDPAGTIRRIENERKAEKAGKKGRSS